MKLRYTQLLIAASLLTLAVSDRRADATAQQAPTAPPIPVDFLQVPDLPVSLNLASLQKTEKGYVLKCSAANNSGEQILGGTFALLVMDHENKVLDSASWPARIEIPPYTLKDLTIRTPLKMPYKGRFRVLMAPQQLVGRESIWRVINAVESLYKYGHGEDYEMPKVQKLMNQYDPPTAAVK